MPGIAFDRQNLRADITAGTASAFVTIPDGLASAILAGVNPMQGLYALMVGTPIAAFALSSQFMYVGNTGAMAVATGDALAGMSGVNPLLALGVLTFLVGLIQFLLGVLRLGGITRFVSNAVMVGFMSGIALLIILGQLSHFTGYSSPYDRNVLSGLDTLLNFQAWEMPTFFVGALTIGLIVGLGKTRLKDFNMILAILLGSVVTAVFNLTTVQTIGDIADIPRGFPAFTLPDFSLIPLLLPSALALAVIGLVQAVGVSKTVPNADGNFPDVSRDFAGQGMANLASGLVQGLPIGGTMSETSVSMSAGAKSRLANIFSGLLIIVVVLLFGNFVERIAMPTIAALLIFAGYEAIKVKEIEDVWDIGAGPRAIMVVTFVATLVWPLQYAVLAGVLLSIMQYISQAASDVRLVALEPHEDGYIVEKEPPAALTPHSVTLLRVYGSVFYAAAANLEEMLPAPQGAERAVVILNLRGADRVGSTFIKVIERYALKLRANGGKLVLTGVHARVLDQIEKTETTEAIARQDIFLADERLMYATWQAWQAAQAWVKEGEEDTAV